MREEHFIVQTYRAKAERLVAQPAEFYDDEASARAAARRIARFRAGVVLASQSVDLITGQRQRPAALAIHGQVPPAWGGLGRAA